MRISFIMVVLALLLGALVPLSAYASAPKSTDSAAAASRSVQVEINKGQMVRLPKNATSVMIADPSIADIQVISPRLVYVHAKKVGDTSLYAIDHGDHPILDVTIEVTHNISKLQRAINELVPDADITLKTVDGGLVINGYSNSPGETESIKNLASTFIGTDDKLVNMITTAGSDQVTLMVKVIEVSRNELKRFGIHMENLFTPGNFIFSLAQGRDFLAGTQVLRNGADSSIYGAYSNGNVTAQGVLDALEDKGLVVTLAEPNLTTTSGKTANFLAGGEFPIPLVDSDGQVTVEYKPFGISLNFTPIVMSKDKISLTVAPEVSNISSVNGLQLGASTTFAIPSIQTRRAETTVELGSGQTFAIAGLLKNDRDNNVDKFPGLGDMPVLGALFRSQEFQNNQSELVILITPIVVRPVSERASMTTPLDGYRPATDLDRVLKGKLYREQPEKEAPETPNVADRPKESSELQEPQDDTVTAVPTQPVEQSAVESGSATTVTEITEAASPAIAASEEDDVLPVAAASETPAASEAANTDETKQTSHAPRLHGAGGFILE